MGGDGGTASREAMSPAPAPPRAASPRVGGPWHPLTLIAWVFCLLVTAALIWSPYVPFGFPSRALHLVLDAVDACIALLVAYLLHNRFVRGGRLQDWLLCQAMILLAVAGLGLGFVLEELLGIRDGRLNVWLPLVVRAAGALLVLVAALCGARAGSRKLRRWAVLAPALFIAVCATVLWAVQARLPVAIEPPADALTPLITGHPALLVAQALAAVAFLIASVVFARQAARRDDELLRWLAPAFTLAAFARVHYVLFPSLYTDWLYTGDLLRTGSYLLLLVGALRELQLYWIAQTGAAVREDRRRLARELHDGLLQELAYIRIESNGIPATTPSKRHIADAADRALDEARAAVNALGRVGDESLGFVLHRAARDLAERYRIDLEVDLDDAVQAEQDQRHALMRITREAVLNAVRHGGARHVRIGLERADGIRRLTIVDDGTGFDPAARPEWNSERSGSGGYGLVSMDDRARGLPGELRVASAPGEGCTVTVTW